MDLDHFFNLMTWILKESQTMGRNIRFFVLSFYFILFLVSRIHDGCRNFTKRSAEVRIGFIVTIIMTIW